MGFKDIVAKIIGGGQTKEKLYVVDASRLRDNRRGRLAPREQISILQRLARFAEQEKLAIEAILEGQPLRVADDGADFNGIKVYYTGKKWQIDELILRHIKQKLRTKEVTVITAETELIARVEAAGGKVMRASTFRKVLEGAGEDGSGPQDGDRRRPKRRRGPRGPRKPRDDEAQGPESSSRPAREPQGGDRVRELIDLVE